MTDWIRWVGVGFGAFVLFFVIHCLVFRFAPPKERARSIFRLFYLHLAILVLCGVMFGLDALAWLLSVGTYAFLFLGYLEFYFTADRSITTRMLILLEKSPNGMTEAEMISVYEPAGLIRRRFSDMVYGRYMTFDGRRYHVTDKGRRVAKLYEWVIDRLNLKGG